MNEPQFVISGKERKVVKKELSLLKWIVKDFWRDHQMEKDMCSFYGGNVMNDEDAQKYFEKSQKQIVKLEKTLNEKLK